MYDGAGIDERVPPEHVRDARVRTEEGRTPDPVTSALPPLADPR